MEERPDRLVKVLPAGDTLAVWLYESASQDGGAYMSLKHRDTVRGMQGEVIISPADVAGVVRRSPKAPRSSARADSISPASRTRSRSAFRRCHYERASNSDSTKAPTARHHSWRSSYQRASLRRSRRRRIQAP